MFVLFITKKKKKRKEFPAFSFFFFFFLKSDLNFSHTTKKSFLFPKKKKNKRILKKKKKLFIYLSTWINKCFNICEKWLFCYQCLLSHHITVIILSCLFVNLKWTNFSFLFFSIFPLCGNLINSLINNNYYYKTCFNIWLMILTDNLFFFQIVYLLNCIKECWYFGEEKNQNYNFMYLFVFILIILIPFILFQSYYMKNTFST